MFSKFGKIVKASIETSKLVRKRSTLDRRRSERKEGENAYRIVSSLQPRSDRRDGPTR